MAERPLDEEAERPAWSTALEDLGRSLQQSEAQSWAREGQLRDRLRLLETENAKLRAELASQGVSPRNEATVQRPGGPLSPRGDGMRRVPSSSLRQGRSAAGRPLLLSSNDSICSEEARAAL